MVPGWSPQRDAIFDNERWPIAGGEPRCDYDSAPTARVSVFPVGQVPSRGRGRDQTEHRTRRTNWSPAAGVLRLRWPARRPPPPRRSPWVRGRRAPRTVRLLPRDQRGYSTRDSTEKRGKRDNGDFEFLLANIVKSDRSFSSRLQII